MAKKRSKNTMTMTIGELCTSLLPSDAKAIVRAVVALKRIFGRNWERRRARMILLASSILTALGKNEGVKKRKIKLPRPRV